MLAERGPSVLHVAVAILCAVAAPPRARAQVAPAELVAAERRGFMTSLVANPTTETTIALHWGAERGSAGYHVLRAPRLEGPYVDLTPSAITGTSFETRGLPGSTMVFRVVSLVGARRDTTGAAYATPHATAHAGSSLVLHECSARSPSTMHVSWAPSASADVYIVSVIGGASAAVLASARTRDTTYDRSGLPAGALRVRVEAAYALSDFPAAGDTTLYDVSTPRLETRRVTLPVSTTQQCN